jgi:hypothetical protein
MTPKYPTWKVKVSPTPSDTIYICDKCGKAHWGPAGLILHCHEAQCKGRKGGPRRMRVGNAGEQKAARAFLKKII